MKTYPTIDAYIKDTPKDLHPILQKMRTTIHKAAPRAEEGMKYGMPTFMLYGNLVHFAAFKIHIGFYPAPSAIIAFKKDLTAYVTSKGAIQFPIDKVPQALIAKMTKFRVKESQEAYAKKAGVVFHKDGSIWAKGKHKNGVMEGYWEWYRKDGSIMRSGSFKKGKQSGKWSTYNSEGKVVRVTDMK